MEAAREAVFIFSIKAAGFTAEFALRRAPLAQGRQEERGGNLNWVRNGYYKSDQSY